VVEGHTQMATRGSQMVKYSSNQYVFLTVMCDSELFSHEKSLCQELVQTFSWVHIPVRERHSDLRPLPYLILAPH